MAEESAFGSIVAQDMVLRGEFECLPPIILEEGHPAECHSQWPTPSQVADGIKAKPHKLDYLDLHLDWSVLELLSSKDAMVAVLRTLLHMLIGKKKTKTKLKQQKKASNINLMFCRSWRGGLGEVV